MKNQYEINGDVVKIFINRKDGNSLETLISLCHFERANAFPGTWTAGLTNQTYYVRGHWIKNGVRTIMHLHRWLMQPSDGICVDHINHNTLDNRMENLRLLSSAENLQNRKGAQKNSKSGIRGVNWHKKYNMWEVKIRSKGEIIYLSHFSDIKEAEQAAIKARAKYMPFSHEALSAQTGALFNSEI